jgi:hypothetical protein
LCSTNVSRVRKKAFALCFRFFSNALRVLPGALHDGLRLCRKIAEVQHDRIAGHRFGLHVLDQRH